MYLISLSLAGFRTHRSLHGWGGNFLIDKWRIHSYPERDLVTLVHPDFYPVRLSGAKAHEVFEELTQLFREDGFSAEEVWQWFIAHNLEF